MNPRSVRLVAAALLLAGMLTGCERDIVRDSAALDQTLIPALELASQRDPAAALLAVEELEVEWDRFRSRYYTFRPDDPEWSPSFDEIDTIIMDVAVLLDQGGPTTEAFEYLADVRMILFELRTGNGIDYFVDPLHEFQEPLADLTRAAAGLNAESLTTADIPRLTSLVEEAQGVWQAVDTAEFEPDRLGLSAEAADSVQTWIRAVSDLLSQAQSALAGKDLAGTTRAVRAVRPRFNELYRLFGNFEGLPEL